MNKSNSDFEKLQEDFRELQLRVTRFSSVEQELINTRDRLDDELVLYKKLNHFIQDSFKDLSEKKFLQLVCETIVDIFELESSVVFLKDNHNALHSQFFTESIDFRENNKNEFAREIEDLGKLLDYKKSIILDSEKIKSFSSFKHFSRGLFYQFIDEDLQIEMYLIGLISKEFDPIYQPLKSRHETIFSVFSQQVQSMMANIRKNDKIRNQIKIISESEDELRKLSQIATKTTNGVIISDEFGRIVWVNDAFFKITGYHLEEVKGRKPKEFLQGKDSDKDALNLLKNALQQKEYVEVTLINYKKNGRQYFNSLQITPVFDEHGKLQNFIALQKDITEEIFAKNELLSVNSRFEVISEKSQIGIWERNYATGKSTYNKILLEQFGAYGTEFEKDFFTHWKNYYTPDEAIRLEKKLDAFINSNEELLEDEFKIIHGKTKEINTLKTLIIAERDSSKNVIKLIGTSIDITENKKHEITLKHHLQQQELLAEISLDLNHITSFKQRINGVLNKLLNHTNASRVYIFENLENNKACSNTFEVCNVGIEAQIHELNYVEFEYIPYWKTTLLEKGIIYSDNIELLPDEVRAILEPQSIKSIIVFPLFVKGDFFGFIGFDECVVYKKWTKSELEMLRAVSGIISNAYERDISEKNIIASEKKYRSIIDNMNLGLIETDIEGKAIYTNKKFFELTLLEDSSILAINSDADKLLKQRLKQKIISSYNKLDENSHEIDFKRKDGIKKTFLVSYGTASDQSGKLSGYISVFLDITAVKALQKNLENALKERDDFLAKSTMLKNFYENVLNNSPSEVIVLNPEFVVTYSNQHLHRKDIILENAVGKSLSEIIGIQHYSDGHTDKLIDKLHEAISTNQLVQIEESYFAIDGKERYTLQSILPIYDEYKTLENIIISAIDITEIKTFEKNLLQKNEELKKINSELDNFVYSVSHDLRSPLLSVKGILSLVFKTPHLDEKVSNYLKMAEKSILRLDGTIHEILDYSRNSRLGLTFEQVNLAEMINNIYEDLKFSTPNKVEFKSEISYTQDLITDKARLNTLLKNIIGNAFKYLKIAKEDSCVSINAKIENNFLEIQVTDNGEGIAKDNLSKIFEMFYRASKSTAGTGLGLYICKEIMNKLNGEISISSQVNEGTTVNLKIPLQK